MTSESSAQEVRRSSRDRAQLGPRLEAWLSKKIGTDVSISGLAGTSATGMSSDTILFDASWTSGGKQHQEPLVARVAPDASDVPVFPSYDMERQARTISLVGELSEVPVPRVIGSETDANVIGAPFFVMSRVDGVVPPDVMPYTFGDNWLFDAPAEDQRRLQDATIDVIASLHAIEDPGKRFGFLAYDDPGSTALHRHVAHTRAWYDFATGDGTSSPLAERGFDWLEEHRPTDEGGVVLCWGDARIGNVLYRDFRPVAVLDWEMASLGPRELDVAWLLFSHRVFQHLAERFGAPGMPDFLRPDDVCAAYESRTGCALRNLDFYMTYHAVQWAIVFLRTGYRGVHFGQREMPLDAEEFMHHKDLLAEMLG
jgi:aminoglycoside phosphotransferase (APT) family kinase protein